MAKFYRFEHRETRLGPYKCCINLDGSISSNHPAPLDEFGETYNCFGDTIKTKVFGFTSLDQAFAWFERDIETLKANNIALRVYDAPEDKIISGQYQAMLDKSVHANSTPVEEIQL